MQTNRNQYFQQSFYVSRPPQDMLEAGELLNAQGQLLNIGGLSRDQRNTAGKALVIELVRLVPEFRQEFTAMANNKFTNGGFNDQQRQDSLESIAAIVKLLQGLKEGRHGMQQLSQAEFDQVKTKLIPYANFACANGTVTKLQEMLYALKTSQSADLEGILYNAKVANLDQIGRDVINLRRRPGGQRYDQVFNRLGLTSQGFGGMEVHELGYMKRLVAREFNIPRAGDADSIITNMEARQGEDIRRESYLGFVQEQFEEKTLASNVVNKLIDEYLGDKPLMPSSEQVRSSYQQSIVENLMGRLRQLEAKLGYNGDFFAEIVIPYYPLNATPEQIANYEVMPVGFNYHPSTDAILRLAVINQGVQRGYFGGDFKIFTCPSMKELILKAGEFGINLGRDFVASDDILKSIANQAHQLNNHQRVVLKSLLIPVKQEIAALDLDTGKKMQLISSLSRDNLRVELPELNELFYNYKSSTIARVLMHYTLANEPAPNAAQGNILPNAPAAPRVNAAALRHFCPPGVIAKMEETAAVIARREEGHYSYFNDLLERFVDWINRLIGRGVTDEKLRQAIVEMQEICTIYAQFNLQEQPGQGQQLNFVNRILDQRNQQEVNRNLQ